MRLNPRIYRKSAMRLNPRMYRKSAMRLNPRMYRKNATRLILRTRRKHLTFRTMISRLERRIWGNASISQLRLRPPHRRHAQRPKRNPGLSTL
jgi:hypothetical protein